jgi:hypothetical protein
MFDTELKPAARKQRRFALKKNEVNYAYDRR